MHDLELFAMTKNDTTTVNKPAFVPEVRQLINNINIHSGNLLLDVSYNAVLSMHYFQPADQQQVLSAIRKNIHRLEENDRLWVAKGCKNAYLSLKGGALQAYFYLLYEIEHTLVDGNYDVKLLAELIEQFGRLFKLYPVREKNNVVGLLGKYIKSRDGELVLAACESVGMIVYDLSDNSKKQLLISLDEALKRKHHQEVNRAVRAIIRSLCGWNTIYSDRFYEQKEGSL